MLELSPLGFLEAILASLPASLLITGVTCKSAPLGSGLRWQTDMSSLPFSQKPPERTKEDFFRKNNLNIIVLEGKGRNQQRKNKFKEILDDKSQLWSV